MKATPMEIFEHAIVRAIMVTSYPRKRPGAVILSLGDERREILKGLRSEDVADVRPDVVFSPKEIWGAPVPQMAEY